jgi:hypothetical protein
METVSFSANDARNITIQNVRKVEEPYRKFHQRIVAQIKHAASQNKSIIIYTLPAYTLEMPSYSPQETITWVKDRLIQDGFSVVVDRNSYRLKISWEVPSAKEINKGSVIKSRSGGARQYMRH